MPLGFAKKPLLHFAMQRNADEERGIKCPAKQFQWRSGKSKVSK
jgi:hypothetical protein